MSHPNAPSPDLVFHSTSIHPTVPRGISPNQEQITAEVEELFLLGLRIARKHLNSGIATLEAPIVRTLLTAATKMMGQSADSSTTEVRKALDELMGGMRVIQVIESTGEEVT